MLSSVRFGPPPGHASRHSSQTLQLRLNIVEYYQPIIPPPPLTGILASTPSTTRPVIYTKLGPGALESWTLMIVMNLVNRLSATSVILWLCNKPSFAQSISGESDCLPAGKFTLCQNLWAAGKIYDTLKPQRRLTRLSCRYWCRLPDLCSIERRG